MTDQIQALKDKLAARNQVVRDVEDALRAAEKRRNATAAELLQLTTGIGVGAIVRDQRGVVYKVARLKPWTDGETAELYGYNAKASGGWSAKMQFIGITVEVIEPAPAPEPEA